MPTMRAVVQRVKQASVTVDDTVRASIAGGLLVYLGVSRDDGDADVAYLVDKLRNLRIFPDEADRMNRDVAQAGGEILVVSAFTVAADARHGRRPTFDSAARPEQARALYESLCEALAEDGVAVLRGSFGDYMQVQAVNDGPVCILLDSRRLF